MDFSGRVIELSLKKKMLETHSKNACSKMENVQKTDFGGRELK